MRVAVVFACLLALLAAGCGASKHAVGTTTAVATRSGVDRVGGSGSIVVETSRGTGIAGVPASALPGITVVGDGEQSAKPDRAAVQIVVGAGDFGPNGPGFAVLEPGQIAPIVKALQGAGATNVDVNRFGQGPFGQAAAATLNFDVDDPAKVEPAIKAAQAAVRAHTNDSLQAANVVFGLSNCDAVEQQAWRTALADAKQRAQKLAGQTGVKLGGVLAVSEVTAAPTPYSSATTGCEALKRPQPYGTVLTGLVNTEQKATVEVALQVTYAIAQS